MSGSRSVEAAPLPPVEFISPDVAHPTARRTKVEVAAEVLRAVPNLAKLCARLIRDPRVPARTKSLIAFAALYVISSVDLIPDFLFPVMGQIDDLLVLAFALHKLLDSVDPDILEEYWDGDGDALELVTAFVTWGAELMPGPLRRLLDR